MKIYFDDRYIRLLKPSEPFEGQIVLPVSIKELEGIIASFERDPSQKMLGVYSPVYKQVKRDLKSLFTVVKAAGGMVRNERGEVLFIHRKGRWDLPKGKIEDKGQGSGDKGKGRNEYRTSNNESRFKKDVMGEGSSEQRTANSERRTAKSEWRMAEAIREVKEETGLVHVEVVKALKPTWHVYQVNGKRMLKKTWWYEMAAPGDQLLSPQTEEDILYVRWFRPEDLGVVLANTFGSLREMIEKYCT